MTTRESHGPSGPLAPVQQAVGALSRDIGQAWQHAAQQMQQGADKIGRTLSHVVQAPARAMQRHVEGMHLQPLLPGIASVSLNTFGRAQRRPQPVFDVAYNPEDIKARLSGVPVYAVINKKEEFVLIAGDAETNAHRNMGLFFFKQEDAQALVDKVREGNPKLGEQSKVMQVGMDAVYQFATAPREDATEGVIFRFMPDAQQVHAAVQLYREAGVAAEGFTGVPVFQAEGLTVKTGRARYTPLFLSKADLDVALNNADAQRQAALREADKAKAARAKLELEDAKQELENASKDQRKAVQGKLDAAAARLEKYSARITAAESSDTGDSGSRPIKGDEVAQNGQPRVEVGCLEEVLVRMENDDKGEWGEVMFVPAGSLTQPTLDLSAPADTGKKKKGKS